MDYTISFKNGHKITLPINNGTKFIQNLLKGPLEHPEATNNFYTGLHLMLDVNDITVVHPAEWSGE